MSIPHRSLGVKGFVLFFVYVVEIRGTSFADIKLTNDLFIHDLKYPGFELLVLKLFNPMSALELLFFTVLMDQREPSTSLLEIIGTLDCLQPTLGVLDTNFFGAP
jgi:hypothetical protein